MRCLGRNVQIVPKVPKMEKTISNTAEMTFSFMGISSQKSFRWNEIGRMIEIRVHRAAPKKAHTASNAGKTREMRSNSTTTKRRTRPRITWVMTVVDWVC